MKIPIPRGWAIPAIGVDDLKPRGWVIPAYRVDNLKPGGAGLFLHKE